MVQQKKHQEEKACDKKHHDDGDHDDDEDDDDMIYLIFFRQTVQKGTKKGPHYTTQKHESLHSQTRHNNIYIYLFSELLLVNKRVFTLINL